MMTQVNLSGLLLINKPSGPTSYDMIRWLKRCLPGAKIGHCGTLDPLAEGLLIILLGKATTLQSHYMGLKKTYLCRLKLGVKTDTADITGQVIEEKPWSSPLSLDDLNAALIPLLGRQMQIPPMYSALKKDGVPLYKLARQGKQVERTAREINIESISPVSIFSNDEFSFRVACSSGTYVRTLAEDIAVKLGTVGTMTGLCREKIGDFEVSSALPGSQLQKMSGNEIEPFIQRVCP